MFDSFEFFSIARAALYLAVIVAAVANFFLWLERKRYPSDEERQRREIQKRARESGPRHGELISAAKQLTRPQFILIGTAAVILLMLLFPPYEVHCFGADVCQSGYKFVGALEQIPDVGHEVVNSSRQAVQIFGAAAIGIVLYLARRK